MSHLVNRRQTTLALLASSLLIASAAVPAALSGTYKLPASLDASVSTEMVTEIWAKVWRPEAGGPYPLVVVLHGNHGTCGRLDPGLGIRIDDRSDYTASGTCPPGYVVTPNHHGYDYFAKKLADQGNVVVSINANRGVNAAPGVSGDAGLNLRRGRLVLRHLQKLAEWNNGAASTPAKLGFSLLGLIDFSHVGLVGHSRGGEGMRAAVAQYRDAQSPWVARIGPVNFEALFEIGPVDGQTSRTLNADRLAWNVLLPGCDGDVSNLQGVRPFDRALRITDETTALKKSTFEVHGANHNFFNTQWQVSDASGCQGQTPIFPQYIGSSGQTQIAKEAISRFFRAHLGPAKKPGLSRLFDPSYPLLATLDSITTFARGFSSSPRADQNFIVDDFDKATGTSSRNVPNTVSGLTQYLHSTAGSSHDGSQRAANLRWGTTGGYLQVNATAPGVGSDVGSYRALEFRVGLRCSGSLCSSPADPTGDVDLSIGIINADGTVSSDVILKDVAVVRRPVGPSFRLNEVLQTVRVPLSSFGAANLASFRGVRFTFNRTANRSIYLGNVRLTKSTAGDPGFSMISQTEGPDSEPSSLAEPDVNELRVLGQTKDRSGDDMIEVAVTSSRPFPIGGALPMLTIGDQQFSLSRFAGPTTETLIFTLDAQRYHSLGGAERVTVEVGGAPPWEFGTLENP